MAIPDDKTTLNFVIDKNIKAKLQVLADMDKRKLGNFVSNILADYIMDYEGNLLQNSKDKEFMKNFRMIFGDELEPEMINSRGFLFPFNNNEEIVQINNVLTSSKKLLRDTPYPSQLKRSDQLHVAEDAVDYIVSREIEFDYIKKDGDK